MSFSQRFATSILICNKKTLLLKKKTMFTYTRVLALNMLNRRVAGTTSRHGVLGSIESETTVYRVLALLDVFDRIL